MSIGQRGHARRQFLLSASPQHVMLRASLRVERARAASSGLDAEQRQQLALGEPVWTPKQDRAAGIRVTLRRVHVVGEAHELTRRLGNVEEATLTPFEDTDGLALAKGWSTGEGTIRLLQCETCWGGSVWPGRGHPGVVEQFACSIECGVSAWWWFCRMRCATTDVG